MSLGSSQVKKPLYFFIFYQVGQGRDEGKRRETLALEGSGGRTNGKIVFCPTGVFLFSIPLVLYRTWYYCVNTMLICECVKALFIFHIFHGSDGLVTCRWCTPWSKSRFFGRPLLMLSLSRRVSDMWISVCHDICLSLVPDDNWPILKGQN